MSQGFGPKFDAAQRAYDYRMPDDDERWAECRDCGCEFEAIRQDLSSEKDFSKVIADLEIDEGIDDFELDDAEGAEGLIDLCGMACL